MNFGFLFFYALFKTTWLIKLTENFDSWEMVSESKNLIKANPTHETKYDKILPHRTEG